MSVSFSWTSLALKWIAFFAIAGSSVFDEYSPVYLKQFGFSPSEVGLTSLFGVPHLFVPLLGLLGDRFRARKLVFVMHIMILIILSLAPLLLFVMKSSQECSQPSDDYLGGESRKNRNQTCCPKIDSYSSSGNSSHSESFITKHVNLSDGNSRSSSSLLSPTESERMRNAVKHDSVPSVSVCLVVLVIVVKALNEMLAASLLSFWVVAVMTFVGEERATFGSYASWTQVGCAISLFSIGILASKLNVIICGTAVHGYFVTFLWVAIFLTMSFVGVPWITYEYLDHRVIRWSEVKNVLMDIHYVIMLFMGMYCGFCYTLLYTWEFWYIAELSGGPVVMAVGGLMRRPLRAILYHLSVNVIKKLGDLRSLAMALFIYSGSQLGLFLIRNPWLVLVINIFQSAAPVLAFSSVNIHFSKAGSKACSGVITGLVNQSYYFGIGLGTTCTGFLISFTGIKATLLFYAIATGIIFMSYLMYILGRKHIEDYETVGADESESDDFDGSGSEYYNRESGCKKPPNTCPTKERSLNSLLSDLMIGMEEELRKLLGVVERCPTEERRKISLLPRSSVGRSPYNITKY